ncbi:MAG: glycosyltransferase [Bacteroidales bacterium]|nr:glycosyltransferase [Bacteroidales bacterium]
MVRRLRIGIIAEYNKKWIGGVYYYQNIIHAFHTLKDSEKPMVVVLSKSKEIFDYFKKNTQYPHLSFYYFKPEKPLWLKMVNKVSRIVLKQKLLNHTLKSDVVDLIIGLTTTGYDEYLENVHKLYWIPDFQEHYLPQYFSPDEIAFRKKNQLKMAYSSSHIIFSSFAALNNFKNIYPGYSAKTSVIPFAVTLPNLNDNRFEEIKKKYDLPDQYFYCPNQFWQHKNHMVILKALTLAKKNLNPFYVVFSGYTEDYRNKAFFSSIQDYIDSNHLEPYVRILGFIDREEQLLILKNALALIQPSRFEGWSTVVEEAKALKKTIICSNLEVHKEQIPNNPYFFDPDDVHELLRFIELHKNGYASGIDYNYPEQIHRYASEWIKLTRMIINQPC